MYKHSQEISSGRRFFRARSGLVKMSELGAQLVDRDRTGAHAVLHHWGVWEFFFVMFVSIRCLVHVALCVSVEFCAFSAVAAASLG
jgi:hypothetical protein